MTELKDSWISVKDGCPRTDKEVIVWDAKKEVTRVDYYLRQDGEPGWAKSYQDAITHWMPKSLYEKLIAKLIKPPAQ